MTLKPLAILLAVCAGTVTWLFASTPSQGLGQTLSALRSGLTDLKPILDKEGAIVNTEIVWSSPFLAMSPVLRDPSSEFRTAKGAIIGVIYVPSAGTLRLEKGTYVVRLKTVEGGLQAEFLTGKGEAAGRTAVTSNQFSGSPLPAPSVYGVPGFLSADGKTAAFWCWDNFCTRLAL